LRTAVSVVTGIGFSRFPATTEPMITSNTTPIEPKMM